MRFVFLMLAFCVALPVWADRTARLEAVLSDWVADVAPDHAVLIVQRGGMPVVTLERGWRVDQPVMVASLSKAITAVCVAQLMREGKVSPKNTTEALLGYGTPGITVAQLLTHGSGLGPDQTQGFTQLFRNRSESGASDVSKRALGRSVQTGIVNEYSYNNENYAVLGEIIAQTSGETYEQACRERVLAPAGITAAQVSARVGATLPWGGWELSVQDYARFMQWAYGADGMMAITYNWPALPLNDWVSYGMGMFQRSNGPGYDFWHFGAYCYPLWLNIGAYAAQIGDGYTVVAAYDACLSGDQTQALERAILMTAFP